MIFASKQAKISLDIRCKRPISAEATIVISQSTNIFAAIYGISVFKLATALTLQLLQAKNLKPI